MGRRNHRADTLTATLNEWDAADSRLANAAAVFIGDLLRPNSPRGEGTHSALERLKHHLGFDRYAMPARVLEEMIPADAAAVLEAARRAGL